MQTVDLLRSALYELVWSEPVHRLAPKFGLSDVGFAKICRRNDIPLPPRGYWARLEAGQKPEREPLPDIPNRGDYKIRMRSLSETDLDKRERQKREVNELKESLAKSKPMTVDTVHSTVKTAEKLLLRKTGWTDAKGLRHAPAEVLDIAVTQDSVQRALELTNRVFQVLLSRRKFEVVIERQSARTYLNFTDENVRLQFQLSEHVKRQSHEITATEKRAQERYYAASRTGRYDVKYPSIPQYDYIPSGVLSLAIGGYPNRSTWNDTKLRQLGDRIEEIVIGICVCVENTKQYEQEQQRKELDRELARQRYEFLKNRRAEELKKLEVAELHAKNLDRADALRRLADRKEQAALADGSISEELGNWLAWVRAKADAIDPTILVSDLILDAPFSERPAWSYY